MQAFEQALWNQIVTILQIVYPDPMSNKHTDMINQSIPLIMEY